MHEGTFRQLRRLRDKYRPGIFGKIAQKLLAVAFCDAGFRVVERGVQGADIDVESLASGDRYALEVKTTDGQSIPVSKENLDALDDRARDGYAPLIAALRIQLLEDWVLASVPLSQLRPGAFLLSKLRAYRIRDLEKLICPAFEAAVHEHFSRVLSGGERYLIKVLAERRERSG